MTLFEKIKQILRSAVLKNSMWLMVLQVFNTIVPLLTLPYITRVLGAGNYGVFSLALNWVTYFQVIVEFGFAFTGARKVSITKNLDLQDLYSRIITARVLLLLLSYFGMNLISWVLKVSTAQYVCMNILFMVVIGVAFQLNWLFQGKQNMKVITIVNAGARLLSVIMVFLMVRAESHLYLYCFCYSATFIFSALFGLVYAKIKYGLQVRLCGFSAALSEMKDGWYLFISQAMSKIFSSVGVTVLGFVATDYAIGVYSAIYKIPFAMILFFTPISQALFPYVSMKYCESMQSGIKTTVKCAAVVMAPFLLASVLILSFRTFVIRLAFGTEYLQYSGLIIPLTIWMLFSIINNFMGIQVLVASGHQKLYSQAITIGMTVIVIFNIVLGYMFGVYGVAIAASLGEVSLTLLLLFQCLKIKKIQ